jgi:ArsR family transcriptional regulator
MQVSLQYKRILQVMWKSMFERYFDVGRSKNSYHLGKLKEAGLVHEERRGKWSIYSLDRKAAGQLLAETAADLDGGPGNDG